MKHLQSTLDVVDGSLHGTTNAATRLLGLLGILRNVLGLTLGLLLSCLLGLRAGRPVVARAGRTKGVARHARLGRTKVT